MSAAIIVMLSVVVVGVGVLVVRTLWPCRNPCPFTSRSCTRGRCPLWSRQFSGCALSLALHVFIDQKAMAAAIDRQMDAEEAEAPPEG